MVDKYLATDHLSNLICCDLFDICMHCEMNSVVKLNIMELNVENASFWVAPSSHFIVFNIELIDYPQSNKYIF